MEVNPDLEILLRAVETVKIPQGTMDQGEWRTSINNGRILFEWILRISTPTLQFYLQAYPT
jgi:hypothetical protein